MSPFLDVFNADFSSQDLLNIPKKREVGFARQTSEQEKIKVDGRSSSLTNWTESCRPSGGKKHSPYKNQEILRRDKRKPSLKKRTPKIS